MEVKEEIIITLPSEETYIPEKEPEPKVYIKKKPVYTFFKRTFDIISSFLGLIILSLPLLIVALIIIIDSPGASPIYVQERIGKNGRKFKFYKFRSMIPNAEKCLISCLNRKRWRDPPLR